MYPVPSCHSVFDAAKSGRCRTSVRPAEGHPHLPTLMSFAACSSYVLSSLCNAAISIVRAMHSAVKLGDYRVLATITCAATVA